MAKGGGLNLRLGSTSGASKDATEEALDTESPLLLDKGGEMVNDLLGDAVGGGEEVDASFKPSNSSWQ